MTGKQMRKEKGYIILYVKKKENDSSSYLLNKYFASVSPDFGHLGES